MSDEDKKRMAKDLMMAIWDFLHIKNGVPVSGFMALKVERLAEELIESIEPT